MQIATLRLLITVGLTLGFWDISAWAQVPDGQEAICTQTWVIFCENWEARPLGDFTSGIPPTYKNGGWGVSNLIVLGNPIIPAPSVVGNVGVESNQVFEGAHSVQIHSPAGANHGGPYIVGYFPTTSLDIYMRVYVRWSAGYVNWPAGGQKHMGAGYAGGEGQNIMPQQPGGSTHNTYDPTGLFPNAALLGYFTRGIIPTGACSDSYAYIGTNGSANICQQQNIVTFQPDQWYCTEIHYRQNSCPSCFDGMMEGWINGLSVGSYTGLNQDCQGDDAICTEYVGATGYIGSQRYYNAIYYTGSTNCWSTSGTGAIPGPDQYSCVCAGGVGTCTLDTHVDLYKWMDALVIGTQRIGCLNAPPSGTPPVPPTNLRVTSLWDQFLNVFSTLARVLG